MSLLVSQHNIKEHVAVKAPFIYGTGMTKSLFLTLMAPSQGELFSQTQNGTFLFREYYVLLSLIRQTNSDVFLL